MLEIWPSHNRSQFFGMKSEKKIPEQYGKPDHSSGISIFSNMPRIAQTERDTVYVGYWDPCLVGCDKNTVFGLSWGIKSNCFREKCIIRVFFDMLLDGLCKSLVNSVCAQRFQHFNPLTLQESSYMVV